jgi:hypothetical protein
VIGELDVEGDERDVVADANLDVRRIMQSVEERRRLAMPAK